MNKKQIYVILSGEHVIGEGTYKKTKPLTEIGLKRQLKKEKSKGHWSRAYTIYKEEGEFLFLDLYKEKKFLMIKKDKIK